METKLFIALIFSLLTICGSAQSNLVVYHSEGSAYILNGSSVVKADRGKKISNTASLQLKINSSCMLIDSLGKSVLVNKPGTFKYKQLREMLKNAGQENVSMQFYAYIYQNFIKEHHHDEQRITAIVQRGHPYMLTPGDSTFITTDQFMLNWKRISSKLTMEIYLQDTAGNILIDTLIRKGTSLLLKTANFRPGVFSWKVDESGTTQPSEQYFKFIIPDQKSKRIITKQQLAIHKNKLPQNIKRKMQNDLFEFWLDKYSAH